MKRLRCALLFAAVGVAICVSAYGGAADGPETSLYHKDPKTSLVTTFPPAKGWSAEKLALAMLYAREAGATAVVVLHEGHLVLEWFGLGEKEFSNVAFRAGQSCHGFR